MPVGPSYTRWLPTPDYLRRTGLFVRSVGLISGFVLLSVEYSTGGLYRNGATTTVRPHECRKGRGRKADKRKSTESIGSGSSRLFRRGGLQMDTKRAS